MEKRFVQRKTGKLLTAAVAAIGLAGFGASQADASLIIDVRAVSAGTVGATVTDGKNVVVNNINDVVRFEVFARVSGTNGNFNDEGFQSAYASFNTVGDIKGNMSTPAGTSTTAGGPVAPFRGPGFQNGSLVDWDTDGDIDIGTGLDETNEGKFFARAAAMVLSDRDGDDGFRWTTIDANTSEIRIGRFYWTATEAGAPTLLVAKPRLETQGALWVEDDPTAVTNKNATTGIYQAGLPVNITFVPEPASLGLMVLAGAGLLGRRRKA